MLYIVDGQVYILAEQSLVTQSLYKQPLSSFWIGGKRPRAVSDNGPLTCARPVGTERHSIACGVAPLMNY